MLNEDSTCQIATNCTRLVCLLKLHEVSALMLADKDKYVEGNHPDLLQGLTSFLIDYLVRSLHHLLLGLALGGRS